MSDTGGEESGSAGSAAAAPARSRRRRRGAAASGSSPPESGSERQSDPLPAVFGDAERLGREVAMEQRLLEFGGHTHLRSAAGRARGHDAATAKHIAKWDDDTKPEYRLKMARNGWIREERGVRLIAGWVPRHAGTTRGS